MVDSISYLGSFFLFLSFIAKERNKFLMFFFIKEIPFIMYGYLINNNLLISVSILSIITIFFEIFKESIDLSKFNLYTPLGIILFNYENFYAYLIAFSLFLSFYSAKISDLMKSKLLLISSSVIWMLFGLFQNIIPIVVINIILIISGIYTIYKLKSEKSF